MAFEYLQRCTMGGTRCRTVAAHGVETRTKFACVYLTTYDGDCTSTASRMFDTVWKQGRNLSAYALRRWLYFHSRACTGRWRTSDAIFATSQVPVTWNIPTSAVIGGSRDTSVPYVTEWYVLESPLFSSPPDRMTDLARTLYHADIYAAPLSLAHPLRCWSVRWIRETNRLYVYLLRILHNSLMVAFWKVIYAAQVLWIQTVLIRCTHRYMCREEGAKLLCST